MLFRSFKAKLAISIIAFAGVVGAAYYALRMFIGAMHNRAGPKVHSFELRARDALVLVPFLAVIGLFALYPQIELSRAEQTVTAQISAATTNGGVTP